MPEHLDAITTISKDMFYCILVSKLPSQKNPILKNKNLPPDHKISEKERSAANQLFFFTWPKSNIFLAFCQYNSTYISICF